MLSIAQIEKNDHEARFRMSVARTALLLHHPFFGQLAMRLPLVIMRDKCKTAATDGRNLYFNPEFVLSLNKLEVVFLVAHEICHCVFAHMIRRDRRDPKLWNIAADYVINGILDNEMVKKRSANNSEYCKRITTINIYLNHDYDHMTSEAVYDLLKKEQDKNGKPEEAGELLDWHIDMNGDGQSDEDGDATGQGDGTIGGKLSDEEREELFRDLRDALIAASQGAGNAPGDFKRLITSLVEPKVDWRDVLASEISSTYMVNYSWMKMNKKSWHLQAILPGMTPGEAISVAIAIDTSGSMSQQMLKEMLSEVAGIMAQYDNYNIKIWQFDAKVYGYKEYTQDDCEDIAEYPLEGGGGTDFRVNWEFMKEQGIEPDQFLLFTDGEPYGSWGDPDYCNTIFLIHTEYGKKVAPFGTTVYYER
jgi:predicted metal-dependent peptidase